MHGKAGKGEQGAEQDSTVGGGRSTSQGCIAMVPEYGRPCNEWYPAQPRVRITSHVCSDQVGPRPSQEVDPMGQDPGQQGTQWVPLLGTRSAAMLPQPSWAGCHLSLKVAPKSKRGNTFLGEAVQGGAAQGHPLSSSKNASGQAEASPTAPSDEEASTEQRQLNMGRGRRVHALGPASILWKGAD